jgi:hypothetical protein
MDRIETRLHEALRAMLDAYAPQADATAKAGGERSLHSAVQAARAALAPRETEAEHGRTAMDVPKPLYGVRGVYRDSGNVYLTIDGNQGAIITPDGSARLLPCERCGNVFWVPTNTVALICDPCATRRDRGQD